ncbi:PF20097 family protein [Geothrix oryzae]|uniref:PF20097 family protein n=1 Tax=Geothrix oryzae TaxID=2927975 RepID=UPI0035CAFB66
MNQLFESCPACSAHMDHGFLSSPTGPVQWSLKEPSVLARMLQTGEILVDISMPSMSYLQGWRCTKCGLIILNAQQ